MKSYTLKQTRNQHGEVFDQAKVEPVLITEQKLPSYVILSEESYQKLIDKLEELEDLHWGQQAQTALTQSSMVGSEEFSTTLERFANG